MADVLITGASRGIGYALTREYLARGARVFATVRDPERAVAVRDLARGPATSGQVVPVRLDVTSEDDRRAASDLVAAQSDDRTWW
jgi:NAD(P)-dependent dehydrogenase (short-subunit alcohol dehydrogenase family)